jgi:hypothetical protein
MGFLSPKPSPEPQDLITIGNVTTPVSVLVSLRSWEVASVILPSHLLLHENCMQFSIILTGGLSPESLFITLQNIFFLTEMTSC